LALVAICLGFLMIQVDATIVNVALPAIGRDLGGSFSGLQWVIDSYTVALASVMLAAGSVADRIGARRVFEVGLVVFTLGSVACAGAPDLAGLIAARALQGLGAAALLPCSLALIAHEFPAPDDRARALGVWGGIAGLGLACGPVLGGVAVALASWRLVFVVNVPVGVLGLILVHRVVGESPRHAHGRFDVLGLVLGSTALSALTASFIEAGQRGFGARVPLACLVIAVVSGGAFIAAERANIAPMLPLGLFRSRPLSAAVGVGVLFNLSLYGALLCLSLYLQRDRGRTAFDTGLLILPLTLVVGVGAIASGRLTARYGSRRPMLAGMALAAIGAALLSLVGPDTSIALVVLGSAVLGLCSLAMPAMTAVAINAASDERAGLASGVLNAARQAGGALGVAVLGSLLLSSGSRGRLDLHTALPIATAAYLVALLLSWIATMPGAERR
jgi:DHA2 family methylenomycin A resistance protein-like MFS transporter